MAQLEEQPKAAKGAEEKSKKAMVDAARLVMMMNCGNTF